MQRTRLEAVRIGQANPSNKSLDYPLNETLKTGTPQPRNPATQPCKPWTLSHVGSSLNGRPF